MFATTKVKLDKELVAKIKRYADLAGYSSPEEFITHALEKELSKLEGPRTRRRSRSASADSATSPEDRPEVMSLLNAALRRLFDLLLFPFQSLPAAVGIVFVSLLAALGMLWAFKRTSNQAGIEAAKRRMYAGIFEIRLFNDSFKQIWRAQGAILRANLTYLRHQLVPMLFILPPLVLAIAQLQFHWAYRAARRRRPHRARGDFRRGLAGGGGVPTGGSGKPQAELELPAGLTAETPALWIPEHADPGLAPARRPAGRPDPRHPDRRPPLREAARRRAPAGAALPVRRGAPGSISSSTRPRARCPPTACSTR